MNEHNSLVPDKHKELGFTGKELSAEHGLEIDCAKTPLKAIIQRGVGIPDVATPVFELLFEEKNDGELRYISLWIEWAAINEQLSLQKDGGGNLKEVLLTDLFGWPVNIKLDAATERQLQNLWDIDQEESSEPISRRMQPKLKFSEGLNDEYLQTERVEVEIKLLEKDGESAFYFTYQSVNEEKILRKIGKPGEMEFELLVGASQFRVSMLNQQVSPEMFIEAKTEMILGKISTTDYFLPLESLANARALLEEHKTGVNLDSIDAERSAEVSFLIDDWAQLRARALAEKIENKKILLPFLSFMAVAGYDVYAVVRTIIGIIKPIESSEIFCCLNMILLPLATFSTFGWMSKSIDVAEAAVAEFAAKQKAEWREIDAQQTQNIERQLQKIRSALKGKHEPTS